MKEWSYLTWYCNPRDSHIGQSTLHVALQSPNKAIVEVAFLILRFMDLSGEMSLRLCRSPNRVGCNKGIIPGVLLQYLGDYL